MEKIDVKKTSIFRSHYDPDFSLVTFVCDLEHDLTIEDDNGVAPWIPGGAL